MDYKPTNILITGGCGFIASNFLNYMVPKYPNCKFVNIDCLYYCASTKNITVDSCENYHFIKGKINDTNLINYILEKENIDIIIHFAAQSHVNDSFSKPLQYTHDNVLGTHVLLECCREYGNIKRFIHVSTDEVYGESLCTDVFKKDESSILAPTNPYAASKAAAEMLVQSYVKSYNFPIIITRGNNVYGINQYPEKLIPRFICLLKDVSRAFETILFKGELGEIYNIGSDDHHEYTVMEVAKMILSIIKPGEDVDEWISYIKDRDFNDQRYYISNQKLKDIGWEQQVDFVDGLKDTVDWYLNLDYREHWDNLDL
jgi:dTDP-D-glucose 4,6-dehydratase